ncbi:facilitated trehalose transporter Tret1-like [Anthonomus grandis grandis]|uniref:facilitated trehalose transporter Tret1-like n=1 Tax=Anthonomus grandis grandis TaxID=2921223 RepID=UPI002164FD0C|nr:facilitated trehalose transporter Tret1-like [Anthonomus grandis grandis]
MTIITGSLQKIQQGSLLFQYLGAYTSTLNVITSGMFYGWSSPSLPKLLSNTSTIPTTTDQGSWIAVMPLISAVIGSLIAGSTVDMLGRKRMILVASLPYFASWIMIAFAKSVELIYVARFIAGMSDGLVFTAVPIYIGEISEPRIRGLLGASVSVTFIFGILLINIIGSYLTITLAALVASCLPLITLVTFAFMPETPYQHLMRGNSEEAKRSLQKLRGMLDVDAELTRVSLAVKAETKHKGRFWDLFTDRVNRKAVFIMVIVRGAQQLSGVTAITFYAQIIFIEAGDNISSETATIIFFSVQLCLSLFASTIVDRAGRRPLLIGSISGGALFLFTEGMYFYIKTCTNIDVTPYSVIPVVGLIGFVIIFSLGMGTVPLLMLGELFSSNAKAFALCFADIYFSIIATSVSKFFQIMKDSFGIYSPFFAFTFFSVCGLILIVLFVPETKGKTLEDIQAQFHEGKNLRVRKEKKRDNGVC